VALLRLVSDVLLDKLEFSRTARNDLAEGSFEVVVQLEEAFFKSLLFLNVEVLKKGLDALLSLLNVFCLLRQVAELVVVLFVPFQAVAVLSWELLQFLKDFMNFLLQNRICRALGFQLRKQLLVAATKTQDLLVNVAVDTQNLVDLISYLFDFVRLDPELLHLDLVERRLGSGNVDLIKSSLGFVVLLDSLRNL
jgi:hypothetical protein